MLKTIKKQIPFWQVNHLQWNSVFPEWDVDRVPGPSSLYPAFAAILFLRDPHREGCLLRRSLHFRSPRLVSSHSMYRTCNQQCFDYVNWKRSCFRMFNRYFNLIMIRWLFWISILSFTDHCTEFYLAHFSRWTIIFFVTKESLTCFSHILIKNFRAKINFAKKNFYFIKFLIANTRIYNNPRPSLQYYHVVHQTLSCG